MKGSITRKNNAHPTTITLAMDDMLKMMFSPVSTFGEIYFNDRSRAGSKCAFNANVCCLPRARHQNKKKTTLVTINLIAVDTGKTNDVDLVFHISKDSLY